MEKFRLPDIYCGKDDAISSEEAFKKSKGARDTILYSDDSDDDEHALLSTNNHGSRSSSESSISEEGEERLPSLNSPSVPKARGWRILRRHLRKGTLLLAINTGFKDNPSPRSRQSVRQAMASEFHEGMNFSIRSCLLVIIAYLALSIAAYSFVFEPSWTIIDSCYFAVTTFTTTGYGDLKVSRFISVEFSDWLRYQMLNTRGFFLWSNHSLAHKHGIFGLHLCIRADWSRILGTYLGCAWK